jgi:peptide-methionine (S)-S-oxide reductase
MKHLRKIGFGGGCHWCTEAVFQSLLGVEKVEQGWISSINENTSFSEAVIVHFDSEIISLDVLVEIHLYTHSSTSNHAMRKKYRSAVYVFSEEQQQEVQQLMSSFQKDFSNPLVTQVLPFIEFKLNKENFLDYYYSNPEKAFCERWINPKLTFIMDKFSKHANTSKLEHLKK